MKTLCKILSYLPVSMMLMGAYAVLSISFLMELTGCGLGLCVAGYILASFLIAVLLYLFE